jgi:fumarate hydratase, class II
MLVTCLNGRLGYDLSSAVAKHAHKNDLTLRESAVKLGTLIGDELDKPMRPERMIEPS